MKLSPEEEAFVRQWMFDELHYEEGAGPAKRLQVEHRVSPADLSVLIAAALPDPGDQLAAAKERPAVTASWPWTEESFQRRLAEAKAILSTHRR